MILKNLFVSDNLQLYALNQAYNSLTNLSPSCAMQLQLTLCKHTAVLSHHTDQPKQLVTVETQNVITDSLTSR